MKRLSLLCVWAALALAAVGCQKSEEPNRHAVVPIDGLMPAAAPDFDPTYVADQTQVKRVHRIVSYEPLDSFRSRAPRQDRRLSATGKPGEAEATGKSTGRISLFRRAGAALAKKLGRAASGIRSGAGAGPSTDLRPDDAAGAEEEPEDDLLDDEDDLDDDEGEDFDDEDDDDSEDEDEFDEEDEDESDEGDLDDEDDNLDDEDEDDAEDEEDFGDEDDEDESDEDDD